MTLGSLYIEAQGYVPVLLENCMVCLAVELIGSWVVLGFSVVMEAFNQLLLINVPWSQEFSGSQDLDLSLLPLVFSLILTVVS